VVRKFDVERPLERPRLRWMDNIKMNFKELGCEGVDWFHVAHGMAKWQYLAGEFRDSMEKFRFRRTSLRGISGWGMYS
jgi:hypothetical protein